VIEYKQMFSLFATLISLQIVKLHFSILHINRQQASYKNSRSTQKVKSAYSVIH